jgi:hypothetical protein
MLVNGARIARSARAELLLQESSRARFDDFYRYVWRYDTPPHIELLIECLQAFEDGAFNRLLVIEPPGHAKSTVATLAYPAWHIGRHPDDSIVGATTTGKLAETFIDAIAEVIETDVRYRGVFPKVRPDKKRGWSRNGLFVTRPYRPGQKDATLAFVGAGGPIIGRRAGLMVLDDTVDEPVARSELMLAKRVDWVRQSVRSRLKPGGKLVIAGTVWAEADVLGSMRDLGTFVVLTMRALSDTTLVYAEIDVPDGIDWKPFNAVEYDREAGKTLALRPGRVYSDVERV